MKKSNTEVESVGFKLAASDIADDEYHPPLRTSKWIRSRNPYLDLLGAMICSWGD
jgi:hypothetical protein